MKNITTKFIAYFIGIAIIDLVMEWFYTLDIKLALNEPLNTIYFTLTSAVLVTLVSYFGGKNKALNWPYKERKNADDERKFWIESTFLKKK